LPYPNIVFGKSEAHGLAFSYKPVNETDFHVPKSLQTILTEVEEDVYNCNFEELGVLITPNLENWAQQGILLLNTALTVEYKNPGSHLALWKPFTSYLIEYLNECNPGLIWMLWGNDAKLYKQKLNNNHHILEAGHPSPLNCNPKTTFKGCKHFSKANEILEKMNGKNAKIVW
jgi:uracil-DNA glycosylase